MKKSAPRADLAQSLLKTAGTPPRYTTIAVYSFLAAAAVLVFAAFVFKFPVVWSFLKSLGAYLKPFVYGFCFAYILGPLVKFFERCLRRESKIHQIDTVIYSSAGEGMMSMDASILELYKQGRISAHNAVIYSTNADLMAKKVGAARTRLWPMRS